MHNKASHFGVWFNRNKHHQALTKIKNSISLERKSIFHHFNYRLLSITFPILVYTGHVPVKQLRFKVRISFRDGVESYYTLWNNINVMKADDDIQSKILQGGCHLQTLLAARGEDSVQALQGNSWRPNLSIRLTASVKWGSAHFAEGGTERRREWRVSC